MNCAKHPEVTAAAYCRTCGKALCETCKRDVRGVIYCEDCLATRVQSTMPPGTTAAHGTPNATAAGFLAAIPGVGAMYNGQYVRGLMHFLIFAVLCWLSDNTGSAGGLFGFAAFAFWVYQIVDAVRSAHFIRAGVAPPDPLGLDNVLGGMKPPSVPPTTPGAVPPGSAAVPPNPVEPVPPAPVSQTMTQSPVGSVFATVPVEQPCCEPAPAKGTNVPIGAIVLIALGVLFLLSNMGLFYGYHVGRLWPLILVAVGGWLLAKNWEAISHGTPQGKRQLFGPAVLLTLGALFLSDQLGRWPFWRGFPLLLIVIGLVLFWQRTGPVNPPPPPPVAPGTGEVPQTGPGETVEAARDRERER